MIYGMVDFIMDVNVILGTLVTIAPKDDAP
jgi:hypothetical protein